MFFSCNIVILPFFKVPSAHAGRGSQLYYKLILQDFLFCNITPICNITPHKFHQICHCYMQYTCKFQNTTWIIHQISLYAGYTLSNFKHLFEIFEVIYQIFTSKTHISKLWAWKWYTNNCSNNSKHLSIISKVTQIPLKFDQLFQNCLK